MKWIEIRINTTEEASDAISEMLNTIGAGGVAIEDPFDIRKELSNPNTLDYADDDFVNSLGEDVIIKAYFPGDINLVELISLINEKISFIANFLNTGEGYVGYSEIDEEDWSTSWKKYYKPIQVTDKLVIKPSWEEYEKKNDEIIIEMDPGMAFGTGTHETTKMCSILIEKYIKNGDTALDIGCGTGILSIVAAKLGAKSIDAVDIDEVAIRVTNENSKLNQVDAQINAFRGILQDVKPIKYDIVFANIIANVIIDISERIPYYLKKDGFFIASGIIKERANDVRAAFEKMEFNSELTIEMGEWVAMVFKCRGSL